ncbi:hypothetical protein FGO68_gene14149 [Halteria grandinella]|uniref:Uncharacterized protein n=1 Tax=Halteria grandinella TaxID=5974 RepID=A0A8J8T7R2_HALGN|nr:hypothetical protein FGO68_gene14149 [Halteria grandinella]
MLKLDVSTPSYLQSSSSSITLYATAFILSLSVLALSLREKNLKSFKFIQVLLCTCLGLPKVSSLLKSFKCSAERGKFSTSGYNCTPCKGRDQVTNKVLSLLKLSFLAKLSATQGLLLKVIS